MTHAPERAHAAIRKRLQDLNWSQARLARESGVDPNTLSDFLMGRSWPRPTTQRNLEAALSWPDGSIEAVAEGTSTLIGDNLVTRSDDSLRVASATPNVVIDWPPGAFDGMSPVEIEEAIAAAKQAGLKAAREIRSATGAD